MVYKPPFFADSVTFHVRRRPPNSLSRGRRKDPAMTASVPRFHHPVTDQPPVPFLVKLNPDGSEVGQGQAPLRLLLKSDVTEIGSDPAIPNGLLLPFVFPHHCVIERTEHIVTVTPNHRNAETFVNNNRIFQTTILHSGAVLRIGQEHFFRFVDPVFEESNRSRPGNSIVVVPERNHGHHAPAAIRPVPETLVATLPGVLEFREETEDIFFGEVITRLDASSVQFKLAPAYTLYMATRYRASIHYRPELTLQERAIRLTGLLTYLANQVFAAIDASHSDANPLAFWMSNALELLYFLKSDRHVSPFCFQGQELLAEAVHFAFKNLVVCFLNDLEATLPVLLSDGDDGDVQSVDNSVVQVLQSAMNLLRRCRVNATVAIQLFSQLFHFISVWTFNRIVAHHPVPGQRIRSGDPMF